MPILHFLNVNNGDCTILKHGDGKITVIDVCNAKAETDALRKVEDMLAKSAAMDRGILGNFNQKNYPVNPIRYMKDHDYSSVFRFIVTHPDMDHIDGIEDFFDEFSPPNFWDTDNNKECDSFGNGYKESDWKFYKNLRDTNPTVNPKRLTNLCGAKGKYWNEGENGQTGNGLHILAPTSELMAQANDCGKFNDASYVIEYLYGGYKVLFSGDSEDDTWEHVIDKHPNVKDIDLLMAPHHGRSSCSDYSFLDTLKPKMTFFGNAPSDHLAYNEWNRRKLPFITNNQANCMVVSMDDFGMNLYVTHEAYARKRNPDTFYADSYRAWYCEQIA